MQLLFGKKSSVSKVDPCGVCGDQVEMGLDGFKRV